MKKKLALSILLGVVFLGLAFWGVEWHKLAEALKRTNWFWMIPALLVMLAQHLIRVHRWWLLVDAAKPSSLRRIGAHCLVGYMAISTFPLRAGEFVRPFLLKTREGIPFSTGLATCVAERFLDILALAVMLSIVLLVGMPTETITIGETTVSLVRLSQIAFAICLGGIGFLIALLIFRKAAVRVVLAVLTPFSETLATKVGDILDSFVEGLAFLKGFGRSAYILFASLVAWVLAGVAVWMVCIGMGLTVVDIPASLGLITVTMVGISIPAAPGFVGTWELFMSTALGVYGVEEAEGIAVAVLHHMIGFVITIGLGVAALGGVTGLVELAKKAQDAAKENEADLADEPASGA